MTTGTIEGAVADSVNSPTVRMTRATAFSTTPCMGLYLDEDAENAGYTVEELLTPEWAGQVTAACEKVEA